MPVYDITLEFEDGSETTRSVTSDTATRAADFVEANTPPFHLARRVKSTKPAPEPVEDGRIVLDRVAGAVRARVEERSEQGRRTLGGY